MSAVFILFVHVILVLSQDPQESAATRASKHEPALAYPASRTVDAKDVLHGVELADPYRWLEDMESEEVVAWTKEQDRLCRETLGQRAEHEWIERRLRELTHYKTVGSFQEKGGRFFFSMQAPGEVTSAYYVREGEGEPRVLLDPRGLSDDGSVRLKLTAPSPTGRHVAYSVGGSSSWVEIHVRDVESGEDLPEVLVGLRGGSLAWRQDGAGFFYLRYDLPEPGTELTAEYENGRILYHGLGTEQEADHLVFQRPDRPDWVLGSLRVTEDGRYFVFTANRGAATENALFYVDLEAEEAEVVELVPDGRAAVVYEHNAGPVFYVRTDLDAPKRRLVAVDLRRPGHESWEEIIAERDSAFLGVSVAGDKFACTYVEDGRRALRLFDFEGKPEGEIPLADIGGVSGGFVDRPGERTAYYSFSGPAEPSSIHEVDMETGDSSVFFRPELGWDPEEFITEHVFFESKDGTRVPMFLCYKGELEREGGNPVMMYGYGAYGWAVYPWFNAYRLLWMDMGGVFATPCIRGGGAYGEDWHQAGIRSNKQNSIDDFIAAAEWLIETGVTSPDRLAIQGGSASGLLPAAAMNQRPELFGASVINWPTLDLIRFASYAGGQHRVPEYGSVEDADEFRVLASLSPYHNLRENACYPPIYVNTGDRDEVAIPAHAYKYVAAVQAVQACANPVLLRVDWGGGHYPSSTELAIREWADRLTFLFAVLEVDVSSLEPER